MSGQYRNILVFATPAIGDVLLATPLIGSLRRAHPHASIDVLVYVGQAGILEGNRDINQVISITKHPSFAEYRSKWKQMAGNYDLSVSIGTNDRAVAYIFFTGKKRVSILPPIRSDGLLKRGVWKRWLVDEWIIGDDIGTHPILQNNRLADVLGLQPSYEIVPPRTKHADHILASLLPEVWRKRPYAVLHLSPGLPYKRWTLHGWQTVAESLIASGIRIVLTGSDGAEETEYLRRAMHHMPSGTHNLAGKLRLSAITTLLENAVVYVGPDTLVTHLAAALGTPTVALFGPTRPMKWGPWPRDYSNDQSPYRNDGNQHVNNVMLLQGPGPCVPCGESGCDRHRNSRSDCLLELHPTQIMSAIMKITDIEPTRTKPHLEPA